VILIYTGNGKGKTSAAMGGVMRALGHGWKVLVVQFMKGEWPVVYGEKESAKKLSRLEFIQPRGGFVTIMGDRKPVDLHRKLALKTIALAEKKIKSGQYGLVVLDEIIVAIGHKKSDSLVPLSRVLKLLKNTPKKTHLILTGRAAPPALVRAADLVTEMKEVKHPFQKGIPAVKGIDF
jgi:cob(I)alamin adenosyltransferase